MKKRIIGNWKTTLIGVAIVTLSTLALVYNYATWSEVIGFYTTAGIFTWIKDSVFHVNPDKQ